MARRSYRNMQDMYFPSAALPLSSASSQHEVVSNRVGLLYHAPPHTLQAPLSPSLVTMEHDACSSTLLVPTLERHNNIPSVGSPADGRRTPRQCNHVAIIRAARPVVL
jgi:hypothetical protein